VRRNHFLAVINPVQRGAMNMFAEKIRILRFGQLQECPVDRLTKKVAVFRRATLDQAKL